MKFKFITFFLSLLFLNNNANAQETIPLSTNFNKIIVSPHIEAVFIKGTKASIVIEAISVPVKKFKYELNKGTLQVYLEGAKTYTKNKKRVTKNYEKKVPLYNNRVVSLIITYVDVDLFSIRGEEKITFQTPLNQNKCILRLYGKSEVTIPTIEVDNLDISIYGDSFLKMEKGNVNKQKIKAYGASKVMATEVLTRETKITAYGNGIFQLHASELIKVNSYGEATILYKGNGQLKKGIVIGESTIRKLI
ncbi:GIN domain-containing protein [Polaribacter atrinae]|uniref:Putative auto-transporter adhesin head GIN domain-containing protein n=1 Tax=Polaribacter atrinae TaxID=1333662 RepID=A0A176TDQ8_9FLAO|nr:DUF2807 domain-containing protein [Polaribacter atrinae]OAD45984.1 hypothetical protein LPB303_04785 [Polaribacter atrinae]